MRTKNHEKEEIATESQPLLVGKKAISIEDADDSDAPDSAVSAKPNETTMLEDAVDILKLGVPIFISSLSWVGVSDIRLFFFCLGIHDQIH